MYQKKIRKAILPVGGLGTRFLPATKAMPKEMLPIIDKPLVHYAVEEALNSGIEEFILITARGKTAIVDYFDASFELNEILLKTRKLEELDEANSLVLQPGQMSYIRQQSPLGLGHAVWCARNFIGDEPFAVLLADDLIISKKPCLEQLIDAYGVRPGNMVAVMSVPPEETDKYGILKVAKPDPHMVRAAGVVEKPAPDQAPSNLAVIGRYILDPSIFDVLGRQNKGSGGEIQLTDAIDSMVDSVPLYGIHFLGQRYDCGSREGFLEATFQTALRHPELAAPTRTLLKTLYEAEFKE